MGRHYTEVEREWILTNYRELGPTKISKIMGKKPETIKTYAKMLRDQFLRTGDERWRLLDSRGTLKERLKNTPETEDVKYYGNVKIRINLDGKYGICPPWLVITDPAFDKTVNDAWQT